MDPALIKLLRLRMRALRRRMFRGIKTPRGALLFAAGTAMIALWLGSVLVTAVAVDQRSDPQTVRAMVPLILLALCMLNVSTSAREKAIHFSPAEVDFLFSGPFTRRQLLLYKLAGSAVAAVFMSLMFSIFFLRHSTLWIAAMLGYLLIMLFVQLFSMAVVLVGHTVAEHAYTRVRKLLLLGIFGMVAVGVWHTVSAGAEQGILEQVQAFRRSPTGFWVLAPLEPFGRTITAERLFPDLVGWAALAAAIDAALLALVIRLDVNYIEAAMAVSAKIYQRMQRARRGGVGWAATGSKPRWHLPLFPRLGGVGPIARRQLTSTIRTARGLIFLLAIMAMATGPLLFSISSSRDTAAGSTLLVPLIANLVLLTILLGRMLPFDFRGDVDQMDWLKSLPLNSHSIAAGQLVTPVMVMTAIHALILGGIAYAAPNVRTHAMVALTFAPVFNWLLFGLENMVFLLFPTRMAAAGAGDMQFVGRMMLEMFAKILILAACCGLAALSGFVAYLICGNSPTATALTAAALTGWLTLAVIAATTVPGVAWAYRQFDVSRDTPP